MSSAWGRHPITFHAYILRSTFPGPNIIDAKDIDVIAISAYTRHHILGKMFLYCR